MLLQCKLVYFYLNNNNYYNTAINECKEFYDNLTKYLSANKLDYKMLKLFNEIFHCLINSFIKFSVFEQFTNLIGNLQNYTIKIL